MRFERICAAVLLTLVLLSLCSTALAEGSSLTAQGVELRQFGEHNFSGEVTAQSPFISLFVSGAEKLTVQKNEVVYSGGEDIFLNYGLNRLTVRAGDETYYVNVTRALPENDGAGEMSPLERSLVEIAFMLLPEGHPFVTAYEEVYGVPINTYTKKVGGRTLSGIPFEYGGGGATKGFRSRWWNRTRVSRYPVGGLDCAEYMVWIYYQAGYKVRSSSASLFFSGKEGVEQGVPGVRKHLVIPSLEEAKIGDIAYNSKDNSYRSGHGNHTVMFMGTARKLGIAGVITKYYGGFPPDKYLVAEVGFSDGRYYYKMMRSIGVSGRSSMCGVGIQFFTSIKENDGSYSYKSPYRDDEWDKSYSYTHPESGHTFSVAAIIERDGRPYQYRAYASSPCEHVMNLSRPIYRQD